jgi:tetratricopeptide (TPR) repeat protein
MADVDDLFVLLQQARNQPLGRRVVLSEQAVTLADELGYENLQAMARLNLVEAYEYSNSGPKMFAPFNWVMQRYEQGRPWFDDALRHQFLWELKWMTGDLLEYPDIPLARIEENLRTTYRIYTDAGEGLGPVHQAAFQLARHVRGVRGAEREFETWVSADRTDLSDCLACEPAERAQYRAQQGRWEDALGFAIPALATGTTCAEEPSNLYSLVVEPLLALGRADEAMNVQRRGWRMIADQEHMVEQVATHMLVLARGRAVDRGLDILTTRLDVLDSAATPYQRMIFAAAATRLLDAASAARGMGQRTLELRGRPVAIDTLRGEMRQYATALMQQFDARNGTPEVGRYVYGSWLQAADLPELPFPATVALPPPPTAAERHPLAPNLSDLSGLTVERLDDLVELAQRYSPVDDIRTLADEWRRRRCELTRLREGADATRLRALGGLEYLLGWSDQLITASRARPYLTSAAELYRVGGDEAEALLIDQWLLAREHRWDEAYAMIPAIDALGDDGQRCRARIRIVQSGDNERRRELLEQVRAFPCAVDADHQLRRIWAAAHSGGTESPEELYAWTGEGLAVLLPGEYADTAAALHLQRAIACTMLERSDEVATELAAAERSARVSGDGPLSGVLLTKARLLLSADEGEEAETLLAQAVALAESSHSLEALVDASGILSDVHRATGRLLEAAEVAEGGLAAVELARASDLYVEPALDLKQARITELSAHISADLEENTRATSLYRRAAELYQRVGELAEAGAAWGAYARVVATEDTLEAVRAYRRGIELMEQVDEQRGIMVLRRQLPTAVQDTDGLDAGLHELELAVALNDTNELRALTDSEFREELADWDFEFERLDLTDTRARMYGTAERYDEALVLLGDIPDRMYDHGAEQQGISSRFLRDQLMFASDRIDDGLEELEAIIAELRTRGDREPTITDLAGIGARALVRAGRDAEADAFWERHTA